MNGGSLRLAARLARRELRGGLKGFRIFLGCIALGVAAIAAVGSISSSMLAGLEKNGRVLLGGEVELRLIHRSASEEELAWLRENSAELSATAELRAMARSVENPDSRRLVEVKAVDAAYPLYGAFETEPAMPLDRALAKDGATWGAIADESLLNTMDLERGDTIQVGDSRYEIRGTVAHEPDRAARIFTLGPRLLVSRESLAASGLEQPGSLIYYHYRMTLPPEAATADWKQALNEANPKAGWRVRDLDSAAPGIERFVERVSLFMTLVGLTALLVGGVGVANATRSYLEGKTATIATFKCLGAPGKLVFQVYLLQILTLSLLGIAGGLVLGGITPSIAAPLLSEQLNFTITGGLHLQPLALAALFGLLTTLAFGLWPLARAQGLPAATLFRDMIAPAHQRPPNWALAAIAAAGGALVATAVFGTSDSLFALGFVAGAVGALLAFRLAAMGVTDLAKRLPRPRHPGLRLAIANLYRPGNPTGSVVMSLGLGVTVLVAIALIQGNLNRQVVEEMPQEAPGFYFIDIQPDQVEAFDALVRETEGVSDLDRVPMLRGRIVGVNGVSPQEMEIPDEIDWVFQGDRGLTWSAEPLEGAEITEGEWWPADYQGDPLVSLDNEVGELLDLHPGDTLTINVLGRDVEVTIANLRRIEWGELQINFVMVFSPGLLEAAPQTHIATVQVAEDKEALLERRVTDAFPNVSAIRVKEALESFAGVLRSIATAVTATAGVTVVAGVLVLAGAIAAGHHRRIYDSVVLKVLGATRRRVGASFLMEYGLIGAATAVIASVIGTIAAYIVITEVMDSDFVFLAEPVIVTAVAATAITLAFGFLGTWRALAQKAAPLLRNE